MNNASASSVLRAGILGLGLFGAAGASAQSLSTDVSVQEGQFFFDGDAASGGVVKSFVQGPKKIGTASATALVGVAHARAETTVAGPGGGVAQARGVCEDLVRFDAPGMEFRTGTVTLRVGYQGVAAATAEGQTGDAQGRVEYLFAFSCLAGNFGQGFFGARSDPSGMEFLNTYAIFEAPVVFGVAQVARLEIRTESDVSGGAAGQVGTASALADIIVRWGGVLEVRDEQGNVLNDVTITSESGFDYRSVAVLPCPADVNMDGNVDLTDFFGFLDAFDSGGFAGEVDATPGIDLSDFFAFLGSFDVGCG